MKRTLIMIAMTVLPAFAIAKEVLFECGSETERGFEGWSIQPYCTFEWVDFSENKLRVYSEKGGDYTIAFQKRIDEMVGYTTVFVDLDIDVSKNCILNYTNVYFSMDGKSWDAIPRDVGSREVQITNGRMNYLYVRVVTNVTFYTAGCITFDYLRVSGEYESDLEPDPENQPLLHPDHPDTSFYIFSFNKEINVETQFDGEYEVYIHNLSGQVVHQGKAEGSTKIEANFPDGIYLVSIIKEGQVVETKKVSL